MAQAAAMTVINGVAGRHSNIVQRAFDGTLTVQDAEAAGYGLIINDDNGNSLADQGDTAWLPDDARAGAVAREIIAAQQGPKCPMPQGSTPKSSSPLSGKVSVENLARTVITNIRQTGNCEPSEVEDPILRLEARHPGDPSAYLEAVVESGQANGSWQILLAAAAGLRRLANDNAGRERRLQVLGDALQAAIDARSYKGEVEVLRALLSFPHPHREQTKPVALAVFEEILNNPNREWTLTPDVRFEAARAHYLLTGQTAEAIRCTRAIQNEVYVSVKENNPKALNDLRNQPLYRRIVSFLAWVHADRS